MMLALWKHCLQEKTWAKMSLSQATWQAWVMSMMALKWSLRQSVHVLYCSMSLTMNDLRIHRASWAASLVWLC